MRTIWHLSLLLLLGACAQQTQHFSGPAKPEWPLKQVDLGEIPVGVPVTQEFTVRNTGGEPLQLREAKPTCHCLTTDWSREPIRSGHSGWVKITFDAAKEGEFYRVVPVTTNADGEQPAALVLKGKVVAAKPAGN